MQTDGEVGGRDVKRNLLGGEQDLRWARVLRMNTFFEILNKISHRAGGGGSKDHRPPERKNFMLGGWVEIGILNKK